MRHVRNEKAAHGQLYTNSGTCTCNCTINTCQSEVGVQGNENAAMDPEDVPMYCNTGLGFDKGFFTTDLAESYTVC